MHPIIRSPRTRQTSPAVAFKPAFRRPHYDCQDQMDALKLVVYIPGVDPTGVGLEVHGPDLVITAPKFHPVRANWRALHLEGAQRDYQLRLRLGFSLAYDDLQAELHGGVLTVVIPKKAAFVAAGAGL